MSKITAALLVLLFFSFTAYAQLTVTPPLDDGCVNSYFTLSNIVISETDTLDFHLSGTSETLVFQPSSGSFNPGVGTVSYSAGGDVYVNINVLANEIVVTMYQFNSNPDYSIDNLTISGIQLTTATPGAGDVHYVTAGSTLLVDGWTGNETVASFDAHDLPFGGNDSSAPICSGSNPNYDLQDNVNTFGNGIISNFGWTFAAGPSISGATASGGGFITDILTNTGTAAETVIYTVTPTSGAFGCIGPTFDVTITVDPAPTTAAAGTSETTCASPYVLSGNLPTVGTGAWAIVSATSGTFDDFTQHNTNFYGMAGQAHTLSWTISNGACPPSSDAIIITVEEIPSVANAGSDQTDCSGSVILSANTPTVGSGAWSSSPPGTFSNLNDPASSFSAAPGSYTLTWTITNGSCTPSTDDVIITFDAPPDVSSAGSDETICGNSYTLSANTPATGTGNWTSNPGDGTFSNPASAFALFTGTPGTTYTLTWTITHASCAPSTDDVIIALEEEATVAAGPDTTVCGAVTLSGSFGGVATSAQWTTVGDGTFDNSFSLTATYTPGPIDISNGFASLTLTTNDPPNSCFSEYDEIVIYTSAPPTVNAGTDATFCGDTPVTLSGGYGGGATMVTWSTSGTGSFDNINLTSAVYTPSPADILAGTVMLTLTTDDPDGAGPCSFATDDVTITLENPATVYAGPDANGCGTIILSGSIGGSATSAAWTTSGDGGFSDPNSLTPEYAPGVNDISNGFVTLTLTTNDPVGICNAASDAVIITIVSGPTVDAGPATQTLCGDTQVSLSGAFGGTANFVTWSTSGSGSFNNINITNAVYTPSPADISAGSVTLTLTTDDPDGGGPCTAVSDNIIITLENPATANAGPDETICSGSTVNVAGLLGGSAGTSTWSTTGDGVFDNPNLAVAVYTPGAADLSNGYATLILTTNDPAGLCNAASDSLLITINPGPTVSAGADTTVCGNSPISLSGSFGGTASFIVWSTSGSGSFDNINLPNAVYNPSPADVSGGTVTLTITTDDPDGAGPCTSASDNLIITFENPATANAGPDETICSGSTVNVAGLLGGSATASIWSTTGDGGFDNPNLPVAVYTPGAADLSNGYVTLTLTTNDPAGLCNAESDSLLITINPGATVSAGADTTVCGNSAISLSGSFGGTASFIVWSTFGSGSFDNSNLPNAMYTPSPADVSAGTVTLMIMTDDPDGAGPCIAESDNMIITLGDPATANAGPDETICSGSTVNVAGSLGGSASTSTWSTSGDGGFDNPNLAVAVYTPGAADLSNGYVTLTLTTDDPVGLCNAASDSLLITINPGPTVSAGADTTVCGNSPISLSGSFGGTANFIVWSTSGSGSFDNINLPNAVYTPSPADVSGGTVTLTITTDDPDGAGPCNAAFEDVIVTIDQPATANAGPDESICSGETVSLGGLRGGTASTTVWSTSGDGTFDNPNSLTAVYTPGASDIALEYVILTLTTDDPPGLCAAATDDVTISIGQTPTANAGSDQTVCGSATTLAGNTPSVGFGTWSVIVGDGGESIANSPDPTSPFSGNYGFAYTLRWTTSNGACTAQDDVQITLYQSPSAANAGSDEVICGPSANLAADPPVIGTGLWTASPGGGTFSLNTDPNSTFDGTVGLTYTLTWTVSNGPCADTTDTVQIQFQEAPTIADAGVDQAICGSSAILSANTPTVGTGTWFVDGSGSVSNSADPSAILTGTKDGTYILTWSISNGVCPSSTDTVIIQMDTIPSVAAAGPDQTLCDTTAFLSANSPSAGNGQWMASPGDGSFSDTFDPLASFTGTAGIAYTLTWTISSPSGACSSNSDDVIITFEGMPTTANAGVDQTVCEDIPANLAANAPAVGTGQWSSSSGGTFSNVLAFNSLFYPDSATSYTLTWTITNGTCTASSDSVVITFDESPAASTAGPDQTLCGTVATLLADTPTVGSGVWTSSPAGGVFSDTTAANSTFTGSFGVTYTLTWTISNGTCAPSSDDLFVTFEEPPTVANAGSDQTACLSTGANLAANTPTVGTGFWIANPGGGGFSNAADPNATFFGGAAISYTLTWSVTNGSCPVSTDSVIVAFEDSPTPAFAGPDQTICTPSASLSASPPTVGTGLWTSSPAGSFSSTTDPNATFGGTPGVSYTVTWTITNGTCGSSADSTVITFEELPSLANAGSDQTLCISTAASLSANTPTVGTGFWTASPGDGFFSNGSSPSSEFTGFSATTYTLTWTISNSFCAVSADSLFVTFEDVPTFANAGPDQTVCTPSTTLAANTPTIGIASWSASPGGGSFSSMTDPNATFSGSNGVTYTLVWSISNGSCAASSDSTIITFEQLPTIANAGADETICVTATYNLSANAPTVGTGLWTVAPGSAGFSNATDANAQFFGSPGVVYTLTWTITNGSCPPSTDDVVITIDDQPASYAGGDQVLCGATATLAASVSVGSGLWTSAPAGTFSDATSATSDFTGVEGVTYTLTWTETNGVCAPSPDDVLITFQAVPTPANAGTDQTICGPSLALAGNVPAEGSGFWNIQSGIGGFFATPTDPGSIFTGFEGQTYELVWAISNVCATSGDTVTVVMQALPQGMSSVLNQCSEIGLSYDLQDNVNTLGNAVTSTFEWNAVDNNNVSGENLTTINGGIINDVLANSTNGTEVVTYSVTPTSMEGCVGPAFTVDVNVLPLPILNPALDGSACNDSQIGVLLDTDSASIGAIGFNLISVDANLLGPAPSNAIIGSMYSADGLSADMYTTVPLASDVVIYTLAPVSANGCVGPEGIVTITVNPSPDLLIDNQAASIPSGGETNIILTSSLGGSTFTFIAGQSPLINGAADGSGSVINQMLTNSTTEDQLVTYDIIATSPEGCSSLTQTAEILVFGVSGSSVITADSVALVALYNSTNGAAWTNNSSWLSSDVDQWYGVTVVNSRVVALHLNANNLTGSVPGAIGSLGGLRELELSDNTLAAPIPSAIGNLTELQRLSINNSGITGNLPPEIGNLIMLDEISLSQNSLTGSIPPGFGQLANLVLLDLRDNALSGAIPAEIGNLANLQFLKVSNNELTGAIPAVIGTLPNLTVLMVDKNNFSSLPVLSQSLQILKTEENKLTFEDIEPNIGITNFTYAPQDTVEQKLSLLVQVDATQNFIAAIGGTANSYQWYKNSVLLGNETNTLTLANIAVEDDAIYHYTATSALVPGLTLVRQPIVLKVSSLERDSIALRILYQATNGFGWSNNSNWLTTPISTGWFGVTINNNRVTGIDLSNNNLSGPIPSSVADIANLVSIDLSNNKVSSLPDLTSLSLLTTLNVSVNNLNFGSLEPNISLPGFNYTGQAILGDTSTVYVPAGDPYSLNATSPGVNNQYQWIRDGSNVAGANQSILDILSMNETNMGSYVCEITNTSVPGLTLRTAANTVWAIGNLSGILFAENSQPATSGRVTLYKITSQGAYDNVGSEDVRPDGTFEFPKVILGNYQLLGIPDTLVYEHALPTYYKNTLYWEEADTIFVFASVIDSLNIGSQLEPVDVPQGQGVITGYVEEDTEGGRVEAPKRVSNAGVSVRRVETSGRGQEEVLTLHAYVLTDDNGEFSFTNLPVGQYRLNIQYPGYPMDPNSFVTIPIGENFESEKRVEAVVEEGKIVVNELVITHIWSMEDYQADVYPNPATSFINFKFNQLSTSRSVNLYDDSGRKMLQMKASQKQETMDLRSLPSGSYIINIHDHGMVVKTLHVIVE